METLGERIKVRRNQCGLNVSELARTAGISKGYLHSIENGSVSVGIDNFIKIAAVLGVSLDWLATGHDTSDQRNAEYAELAMLYHHREWAKLLTIIATEMEMDRRLWGGDE